MYSCDELILLSVAKSTHLSPWASVCHALHSGETPVCVRPGAGTGVLGPRAIVVVGVTTPRERKSRRELELSSRLGHLPRSEAPLERRRLEVVASIIAGKCVVSHHILAFSVYPDVRQVAEKRNHLFVLAKKGEVFLCDVGPAALRRIQNVPRLEPWELGEEFVEVRQRRGDLFSVVRWQLRRGRFQIGRAHV